MAKQQGKSCVSVFIDIIAAFPSIVVSLSLPLPDREPETGILLTELGFDEDASLENLAEQYGAKEWTGVSAHMQHILAAYQEDQWMSTDNSTGVTASAIGTGAGLPPLRVL